MPILPLEVGRAERVHSQKLQSDRIKNQIDYGRKRTKAFPGKNGCNCRLLVEDFSNTQTRIEVKAKFQQK